MKEVYVDTVGDEGKYQAKLSALFPSIRFTVSKKADSLFAIVSAASIAAKVTRDVILKQWQFTERSAGDIDTTTFSRKFGSGYPVRTVCDFVALLLMLALLTYSSCDCPMCASPALA